MQIRPWTGAALAALLPLSAHAAETAPDIIVTATGAAAARHDIGQAVTVLDAATLATRQTQAVADLLADVPGVVVSANGPIGGFAAVRIRGADGEQTLALIDGVKVNDPASPGGGFDFGTLLTGTIDRIEVLRGPNSVPWGSEAIGGVVNILTARPQSGLSGRLSGEYGTADRSRLNGTLFAGTDRVRATLSGGWFRDNGISAFKNGTEADGLRQYAGHGRLEVDITRRLMLDLRGWHAHSRIDQDGFPPPFYGFADTSDVTRAEQSIGYVGLRHKGDRVDSRLAVTLSDINRDAFASPDDSAAQYLNHGRTERIEYRGDWALSRSVRTLFGAEHEATRTFDGYATQKTHVTSGFMQVMTSPVRGLTATLGLRLDDHASYGTHATQAAHLSWRANSGLTLRAAYGEGFKAPTLFQLFSFYGNDRLNPETARSYDLGMEQVALNGRLTLVATAFLRNTRNQINFISCYGQQTGLCTDRPYGTYENRGRTRAKGIETTVQFRPDDRLDFAISYTLLRARDLVADAPLPRRPRHSLSAQVDWQSPLGVKLGASVRHIGQSRDTDFATYEAVTLPAFTLLGLRAAWPVSDRMELFGRIENLTDARAETVSGYGSYGRTVHAGARVRF